MQWIVLSDKPTMDGTANIKNNVTLVLKGLKMYTYCFFFRSFLSFPIHLFLAFSCVCMCIVHISAYSIYVDTFQWVRVRTLTIELFPKCLWWWRLECYTSLVQYHCTRTNTNVNPSSYLYVKCHDSFDQWHSKFVINQWLND